MNNEYFLLFADFCQAAIMPICLSAYIPQWVTIIKNRSSENISLRAYLIWTFSSLLGVVYAVTQVVVYGNGAMLLLSSLVSLLCLLMTTGLVLFFRRSHRRMTVDLLSPALRVVDQAKVATLALKVQRSERADQSMNEIRVVE